MLWEEPSKTRSQIHFLYVCCFAGYHLQDTEGGLAEPSLNCEIVYSMFPLPHLTLLPFFMYKDILAYYCCFTVIIGTWKLIFSFYKNVFYNFDAYCFKTIFNMKISKIEIVYTFQEKCFILNLFGWLC